MISLSSKIMLVVAVAVDCLVVNGAYDAIILMKVISAMEYIAAIALLLLILYEYVRP